MHTFTSCRTKTERFYTLVLQMIWREESEHKSGISSGFSKKYNVSELLYYEVFDRITEAIKREKQLKEWKRDWKIELVKTMNIDMLDLAADWSFEIAES